MPHTVRGRWFDDLAIGDSFSDRMTVTEAHFLAGCALYKDYNPVHTDDEFARGTRFGRRILHGATTTGLMIGLIGETFHGTAIAMAESSSKYTAPVFCGDTLTYRWTVQALTAKPRIRAGLVDLDGECHNQKGEKVAAATCRMLIRSRESAPPHEG
ncbi:MAG: hypothetical protein HYU36_21330 [Planctomycetes bacterium]|nr:hypothetical protein [Planctomycetota bacterium]